jgi:hypothetical protein
VGYFKGHLRAKVSCYSETCVIRDPHRTEFCVFKSSEDL